MTQRKKTEGILLTDQYQLTMAQVYFRHGIHEKPAQFDHFFREYPDYGIHKAGYCINAGMQWLLDWMGEVHFSQDDIDYLAKQTGRTGKKIFNADFLNWLKRNGHYKSLTLHAIPEGRVVHPNMPLTVVRGPLAMAQIVETALLNHLNYQTLIATKAARIREIIGGQMLLEFGARRGHDLGVHAGARAALIGGADFTSNVAISKALGIPAKGTHAHSMVQAFLALGLSELDAFRSYAEIYPDDCLLLVDTIDTLNSGIPNAIKVFEELKRKGHQPVGIRLDSGDLAYLSIQATKMLDQAGFTDTTIFLSNELDEVNIWQIIDQIKKEGPKYDIEPGDLIKRLGYGVGTRLITSAGDSSLGGVYKLVALQNNGKWVPAIKISESPAKTPNPDNKQVWRIYDKRGKATADLISLYEEKPSEMDDVVLHHISDKSVYRTLKHDSISSIEPLLTPVLQEGKPLNGDKTLEEIRATRKEDVKRLDPGVKRIMNPHIYHVSLTPRLWQLKQELVESVKQKSQ